MPQNPVILHLSDLHFGNSVRYESPGACQTFLEKTKEDLDSLKERGVEPNIIIITGDLTDKGRKSEFELARNFLDGLIKHLQIPKKNTIVVPGNHDVNWDLCRAARLNAKGREVEFRPPYFEKFGNFKRFYDAFFHGSYEFTPKLYQVYRLQQYGLLIAGFNSCVKESELKDDHFGYIDLNQVKEAWQECDRIASPSELLRVAVMHHNFRGVSSENCENLQNMELIRTALVKAKFRIVMHGHRHFGDFIGFRDLLTDFEQLILSTGSTGLDRLDPKGIASQYQLVKIEPKVITLYMRRYSTFVISESDTGSWEADSSRADSGIPKFPIRWLAKVKAFAIPSEVPPRRKEITFPKLETKISVVRMGRIQQGLLAPVIQRLNTIQSSFKYELESD